MNYNIKHKKASFIISLLVLIISLGLPLCYFLTGTISSDGAVQFGELMNVIKAYFENLDFKSFDTYVGFMLYFLPVVGALLGLFGKLGRTPNILNFALTMVSLVSFILYIGKGGFTITLDVIIPVIADPFFFDFKSASTALINSAFIMTMVNTILTFVNVVKSK